MSVRCPCCDTPLAEDGPCEVHGQVRVSEEYGLRLDGEFVCANCETALILEDAGNGVLGTDLDRRTDRCNGGDYRV